LVNNVHNQTATQELSGWKCLHYNKRSLQGSE
jgi:hypothetical protein